MRLPRLVAVLALLAAAACGRTPEPAASATPPAAAEKPQGATVAQAADQVSPRDHEIIETLQLAYRWGYPLMAMATNNRKTYAESKPGIAPELPVAKGSPNIIWILMDDVGYGASSAFGGGARTPVLEQLASEASTMRRSARRRAPRR